MRWNYPKFFNFLPTNPILEYISKFSRCVHTFTVFIDQFLNGMNKLFSKYDSRFKQLFLIMVGSLGWTLSIELTLW